MVLPESGIRISDRDGDAGKASAGPTRRKNQLFCPRVSFLLLLLDADHNNLATHRAAPDELFLSCRRILLVPSVARLSVDHVSIHVAFAIASAVSIFLVVSYLRLV